jgi:hypothetical protein
VVRYSLLSFAQHSDACGCWSSPRILCGRSFWARRSRRNAAEFAEKKSGVNVHSKHFSCEGRTPMQSAIQTVAAAAVLTRLSLRLADCREFAHRQAAVLAFIAEVVLPSPAFHRNVGTPESWSRSRGQWQRGNRPSKRPKPPAAGASSRSYPPGTEPLPRRKANSIGG